MKLKLIHQIGDKQELEYYSSPVDVEHRYFELSRERHNGPSAIKISRQLERVIPPAYYRLDVEWTGPREQDQNRAFLWADRADQFLQPSEAQIRAVGRLVGSGRVIGLLAGFTDREWRYLVSGERSMAFARWRVMLELAGLVDALPTARELLS